MSESIKVDLPRTFETIQSEFANLCARAGHLQYQTYVAQKELEQVNSQIQGLNFEAAAMKAASEAKAPEAK